MNALIKEYLNDPDSMKVHSTRIAPVDDAGLHHVFVEFSAANAFGGMVRNTAIGMIDNETCEAVLVLEIEPRL